MRLTVSPRASAGLRTLAIAIAAAALPALGACQTKGEITGSLSPPLDVRDRHPIVLTDGARVLDVFVEGAGGMSTRGREDLSEYFGEYRRSGSGILLVQVPAGAGTNPNTRRALEAIRGAAGGRVSISQYRPDDPNVASPIRLTFRRLQAKVASQCGLWPDDLGVGDYERSWKNEQYWNFGCATRSNFAAQVADPVDLVRGRRETPPEIGRRMFNFGQIRKGEDPSTTWKDPHINTIIAQ